MKLRCSLGWSMLVLLVVAGVGVVAIREQRQTAELEATIVRLAAQGHGGSIDEMRALVQVGLDPGLQARARAWLDKEFEQPDFEDVGQGIDDWNWFLAEEPGPPAFLRTWHDKVRPRMERLASMLADERLSLANIAYLPDRGEVDPKWSLRLTSLSLDDAARWLAVEAWRASSPKSALDQLDRIIAAHEPVELVSDAINLMQLTVVRDRALLALVYRGKADAARIDAWLQEPSRFREQRARGERRYRILTLLPDARALIAGKWRLNVQAKQDMARRLEISVLEEARYASDAAPRPLPIDAWINEGGTLLTGVSERSQGEIQLVLRVRQHHRTLRLAVRLLRFARATGAYPADESALRAALGVHARLLDAGPWDLALRYERFGPRCRIRAAPDSPVPPVINEEWAARLRSFEPDEDGVGKRMIAQPWPTIEMTLPLESLNDK